uniref:Uncharacterized protein n=1 Tax=Arundo donax TaxID=35708 RepID=A0A0A9D7Y3_ARUDO
MLNNLSGVMCNGACNVFVDAWQSLCDFSGLCAQKCTNFMFPHLFLCDTSAQPISGLVAALFLVYLSSLIF